MSSIRRHYLPHIPTTFMHLVAILTNDSSYFSKLFNALGISTIVDVFTWTTLQLGIEAISRSSQRLLGER